MFESLDIHEPLLINSIGHSAGVLLFSGFLVLVLRERRRGHDRPSWLPAVAATLALLWNAGSLAVLAGYTGLVPNSDLLAALSFAVLSLLPAVLLHISLRGTARPVWLAGYVLSAVAVTLHLAEFARPSPSFHQAAIWVITLGFGLLSVIAMLPARRLSSSPRTLAGSRIPVSMCLFLFAISFVHFGTGHASNVWSAEIALHHAGIPLALYVLLQDYRFLLLDAFLRFLATGVVASGLLVLGLLLDERFGIHQLISGNAFLQGLLIVLGGLLLVALIFVRGRLQLLLTRVVFRRPDNTLLLSELREAGGTAASETAFLDAAAPRVAAYVQASRWDLLPVEAARHGDLPGEPLLLGDSSRQIDRLAFDAPWAVVCVPLRFSRGDGVAILLGAREGRRRYLSEDLQELARLAAVVVDQVERFRNSEMQRLVAHAELRALASQINPHFLFNSLNTLYGTIPREAHQARRLVVNLSDIFRYFLQPGRTFISLTEELQIVQAYLQIESLRLGGRLKSEIDVDDAARKARIPILSVQPLVENAVKHGVAARSGPGTVKLSVRTGQDGVHIAVSDDGEGFQAASLRPKAAGAGVGLDNVRQRLKLSFGGELHINSAAGGSTVSFFIPAHVAFPGVPQEAA